MSMPVQHYLYSLDASADNFSVVVFGAEWTCMLALPQKVESTTITRPLWTVTVEENKVRGMITSLMWWKWTPRSHSVCPQFRFTEPNVAVVTQYVCQTKCRLDNFCKVKSWAWSQWKIPWQRDEVFSGHCGIASQSDGGWPALFTSLSRLTGSGNITNMNKGLTFHHVIYFKTIFDYQLYFTIKQMIKLSASNIHN